MNAARKAGFSPEGFREVRGTAEFRKWFEGLRALDGIARDRALERIGPHVIMTAYMHPDGLVVKPGQSNFSHLATNRGYVHDYSKQYWTEGEITALRMNGPLKRYGMFGPIEDQAVFFALWLCHCASMGDSKFQKVLFLNDASGAVDTAIMLAWDLQRQKAGQERKNIPEAVLCPEDSFFGSGIIGRLLSRVNGYEYRRGIPESIRNSIRRVLLPSPKRNPDSWFSLPPLDDVAVFISEIVQGAGGDVDLSAGLLKIQGDLRRAGVLIAVDEASTAPGKMGSCFALAKHNLYADMLICGKGIAGGETCAAIIFSDSASDLIDNLALQGHHFLVGRTMAGGSNVCSKALDFHLRLEEDGIIDRVDSVSKEWRGILAPLREEFPDLVAAFRGKGTHYSFEFSKSRIPLILRSKLLEDGMLVDTEGLVLPFRFNPDFDSAEEVRNLANSMRKALLDIRQKNTLGKELPAAVMAHFRLERIRDFAPEFRGSLLNLVHQYCEALQDYPELKTLRPPYGILDWISADNHAKNGNEAGAIGLLRGEFILLFVNGELKGVLNFEISDNEATELHAVVDSGMRKVRYGPKLYERFIRIAQAREGVEKVIIYNLPPAAKAALRNALPEGLAIQEEDVAEGRKFTIQLK